MQTKTNSELNSDPFKVCLVLQLGGGGSTVYTTSLLQAGAFFFFFYYMSVKITLATYPHIRVLV